MPTGTCWSWESWAGGAAGVLTRVSPGLWTRSAGLRSACSSLAVNCRARPSSAVEAPALSYIGQETFQSAVTGWRFWQWLVWTRECTTSVTSTAGHRVVTTWTACRTTAFGLPQRSLVRMKTAVVRGADERRTCEGLMTAVPPRCCRGCVSPCRRRTGSTSRLVARTGRRRTRPCVCCATVSVLFTRWRKHRQPLRRVLTWCDWLVTSGCSHMQLNKPRDKPLCLIVGRLIVHCHNHQPVVNQWSYCMHCR